MRVEHFRYGRGAEGNGIHLGPLTIWFSYSTPVAFNLDGQTVVRQNDWGPTTGRHLGAAVGGVDKEARIPGVEFVRELDTALRKLGERLAA